MKFLFSILFILAFSFGLTSHTLAAADVAVLDDITFSKNTFIVGDTVRVYAVIRNAGDVDVTGTITFFIGTNAVGGGEISMPKNGQKEEVFTDFVVPEGDFNIRVEISNTFPADTNTANNEILTGLIEPVADTDRDGVPDASDNCPNDKNEDQRNFDGDAQGNVCDADIDGDGLSNTTEQDKGTDPLNADTDGDGISDKDDPRPLGEPLVPPAPPTEPSQPAPKADPLVTEPSSPADVSDSSSGSVAGEIREEETEEDAVLRNEEREALLNTRANDSSEEVSSAAPETSLNALFTFEEVRWATYNFRLVGPAQDEGYRYEWNFGDGTTSNRREVTHYFGRSGSFPVILRVTNPEGVVREDTVEVHIAFFDMQNRSVRMLIIFLVIILLIGLSAFYRLGHEATVLSERSAPKPKTTKKKKEV